jgi:hypothetical protein
MMRADYESATDAVEIELEPVDRLDHGVPVEGGAAIVHFAGDRPVVIDVIGTRKHDFEQPLRVAAERYGMDAEALIAASKAAIAAPDRPVRLDVGARIAA